MSTAAPVAPVKTALDHARDDLARFFAAGQGKVATETIERFVLELIKREVEAATGPIGGVLSPILDAGENFVIEETDKGLTSLAPSSSSAPAPSSPAAAPASIHTDVAKAISDTVAQAMSGVGETIAHAVAGVFAAKK